MPRSPRSIMMLIGSLVLFALGSSLISFDGHALARDQKSGGAKETSSPKGNEPTKNPDGSTTTTTPNDTYAKGGTKETTVDKDGKTVTREVWRDKNGKPVRATGKDGIRPVEIEWKYDSRGRLIKVLAKYSEGSRISLQKEYKDDDDNDGTTDISSYNTWGDDVTVVKGKPADDIKKFIESFAPRTVTYALVPPSSENKKEPPKKDPPKQETAEQSAPTQTSGRSQETSRTQLVGIVYDKNDRPGDQATMTVTNDPGKYENIPGLGVVVMNVNAPRGPNGQVNLEAIAVNLGDAQQRTANQPLTLRIPSMVGYIGVSLSSQGNPTLLAQTSVPIAQGAPVSPVPNTGSPNDFNTPPVCLDTSFIRGPLSGDSGVTRIMVDSQPATIIAESPRSVFFKLPEGIPAGPHQLTVQDGTRTASFPIVKMSITGHIDKPALQRGQKTNYSVTVNFGKLPQEFWQRGGGSLPELVNPLQIQQAAPDFHIPQATEPGVVLLAINNASRDTVSIRPSQNERVVIQLHQQDFQNNQFTTRGEVQSKKSGSFVLDLLAQAFFAPIPGQETPGGTLTGERTGSIARQFSDDVNISKCKPVSCGPARFGPGLRVDKVVFCATVACGPAPCECRVYEAPTATQDRWKKASAAVLTGEVTFDPKMDYACYCTQ